MVQDVSMGHGISRRKVPVEERTDIRYLNVFPIFSTSILNLMPYDGLFDIEDETSIH